MEDPINLLESNIDDFLHMEKRKWNGNCYHFDGNPMYDTDSDPVYDTDDVYSPTLHIMTL